MRFSVEGTAMMQMPETLIQQLAFVGQGNGGTGSMQNGQDGDASAMSAVTS